MLENQKVLSNCHVVSAVLIHPKGGKSVELKTLENIWFGKENASVINRLLQTHFVGDSAKICNESITF